MKCKKLHLNFSDNSCLSLSQKCPSPGDFLRERVATLDDPRSIGEALKGSRLGEFWKYRVGDYRIITNIEDGVMRVLVLKVGNRREVYKK